MISNTFTTNAESAGITGIETHRHLGEKSYEIKDHLGNVRATVSDIKNAEDYSDDFEDWRFLADIRSLNNYHPYGSLINAGSWSASSYNFGYNGMLKEGIGKDVYHTLFRTLSDGRWWSPDPKEASFPWRSPYVSMGNNPISFVDPKGDKEYKSEKAYKKETGNDWSESGEGDWLKNDRLSENSRWNSANQFNLENKKVDEYVTIEQRTGFYKWLVPIAKEKGFEVRWIEGASKISNLIQKLTEQPYPLGSEGLTKFANEGNKAIFDDIIPKISDLLVGQPIVGEEAKQWDSKMIYYEQSLIQPMFDNLETSDFIRLELIMKSNMLNTKHGNSPIPYVQGFIKESEYGVHRYPLLYNLKNVNDRHKYGMQLLQYENSEIKWTK